MQQYERARKHQMGSTMKLKLDSPDIQPFYSRIWETVKRIPRGQVATYGQVAALAGSSRHARSVGYALRCAPMELPWHRVINAKGCIAFPDNSGNFRRQTERLEAEGILVLNGRVALKKYRWRPVHDDFPEEYFAAEK